MKKLIPFIFAALSFFVSFNAYAVDPLAKRVQVEDASFSGFFNGSNCDNVQECLGTLDGFGSAAMAFTNKTIDGDLNTLQDIAYSSIKSTSRTGLDTKLVTGTAGATNDCAKWNADGDLVSAGAACGSGGSGAWGAITGTLSDQTDLQTALDAKQDTLTTGNLTANSPLSFNNTRQVIGGAAAVSIADAAADGSTKGAASFTANDFNAASGNISIDYTNGQAAASGTKGFLTGADWDTFNGKVSTSRTISTTSPLTGGGDLSANRTFAINDAAADGSTKGAASFTAADFDASSGNISIDYTNGQAASGAAKGFLTSANWTTFNNKISQSMAEVYAADAVGTDSYAITVSPVPAGYTTGGCWNFKAGTANTGAATLNVNALGAKTIKKQNDVDLADNDIESGQIVTVCYDGTNFQMQSQLASSAAGSGTITSVYDVSSGAANQLTIGSGQYLDGGTATVDSGVTEGMFLSRGTDCSGVTAEGRVCWDTDDDVFYIGSGSAAIPQNSSILTASGTGSSADRYFAIGHTGNENATETNVQTFQTPYAGILAGLRAKIRTAPGAGTSWIFTIRTDQSVTDTMADTTITCTIADAALKCSDLTHLATISADKIITVFMDRVSTASAPGLVSIELIYIRRG